MATVNLGRFSVTENSYRRAREISANKTQNASSERKTAQDVLGMLRDAKPGWVIDTHAGGWQEGVRNIQISPAILERMAADPEAFVQYKAFILDLEYVANDMEAWKEENPGYSLQFNFNLALEESVQAAASIRTLLGQTAQTSFELSENRSTWTEMINQRLGELREGRAQEADGSRSWMA